MLKRKEDFRINDRHQSERLLSSAYVPFIMSVRIEANPLNRVRPYETTEHLKRQFTPTSFS